MSDTYDSDSPDPQDSAFTEFIRGMFGDAAGEEAARAMRAQGFDPSQLSQVFGSPANMQAALGQFRYLMNSSEGSVNWSMASDMATRGAWDAQETSLTAAQAQRARQAMTVADLWLDPVTSFAPGSVTRHVWTRTEWISGTLDVWKRICEPVAANISRALGEAMDAQISSQLPGGFGDDHPEEDALSSLPEGLRSLMGQTRQMMPRLSALMFAGQLGQALSALAKEALGSTDVGIPLAPAHTTALVMRNVEEFADGLEIPFEEVLQFMALRECAHQRLFSGAPWLASDLVSAVERYSAHIALDTEAIAQAAHSVDPSDPSSFESALGEGVFASSPTTEQVAALERLETLLALVEGWVDVVTMQAALPYLPHIEQLREMMRRRRASGGSAERLFAQLIGLTMRPRQARGASKIFSLVQADGGVEARDALWAHPDVIPTAMELSSPDTFLELRRSEQEAAQEMDEALASLLDGTMGWAEGLSPEDDPESETLRQAGFSVASHEAADTSADSSPNEAPAASSTSAENSGDSSAHEVQDTSAEQDLGDDLPQK